MEIVQNKYDPAEKKVSHQSIQTKCDYKAFSEATRKIPLTKRMTVREYAEQFTGDMKEDVLAVFGSINGIDSIMYPPDDPQFLNSP